MLVSDMREPCAVQSRKHGSTGGGWPQGHLPTQRKYLSESSPDGARASSANPSCLLKENQRMAKNRIRCRAENLAPTEIANRAMAEIELFRELGRLAGAKLAARIFQRDSPQSRKIPSSNSPPQPDEE